MLGQRIYIRIIEGKYLRVQRINRYRYEVMSKKSKYFGKKDFLCSTETLKEGHTFSVRLNSEQGTPGLEKVFREIPTKGQIQLQVNSDVDSTQNGLKVPARFS